MSEAKRIFVVAGEHSGDLLGGKLLHAIRQRSAANAIQFSGVGGEHMQAQGLPSIFPLQDVAVMGPAAILARLPKLVRRVYQTVDAALAFDPDLLVIIDSPEFTHPIAKRVRQRRQTAGPILRPLLQGAQANGFQALLFQGPSAGAVLGGRSGGL